VAAGRSKVIGIRRAAGSDDPHAASGNPPKERIRRTVADSTPLEALEQMLEKSIVAANDIAASSSASCERM